MKKLLLLLFTTLSFICLIAQPTKTLVIDENAQLRKVESFNHIEVSGNIDVYISQGEEGLAVSCTDDNFTNYIITKTENNILKIYFDENAVKLKRFKGQFKAYVSVKNLASINLLGAVHTRLVDDFHINNVQINISGACSFNGKIFSENINTTVNGASSIKLSGKTTNATLNVAGASFIYAADLLINNCSINVSGASSAEINVQDELAAFATGKSLIIYHGKVKNIKATSLLNSSIKKAS
jgi:hypothetical protein